MNNTVEEALSPRPRDDFRAEAEGVCARTTHLSRSAVADLCTAIVSVAIGATVFGQLTFGVMSLGPALAHEAAQRHAIETFPLESWLGGLRYGVFLATPSLLTTIAAMAGLAVAFSMLTAFAGVVANPVRRRLGRHRRLLEQLVVELLPMAWSKLH